MAKNDKPDLINGPLEIAEQLAIRIQLQIQNLTGSQPDPMREQMKASGIRLTQIRK